MFQHLFSFTKKPAGELAYGAKRIEHIDSEWNKYLGDGKLLNDLLELLGKFSHVKDIGKCTADEYTGSRRGWSNILIYRDLQLCISDVQQFCKVVEHIVNTPMSTDSDDLNKVHAMYVNCSKACKTFGPEKGQDHDDTIQDYFDFLQDHHFNQYSEHYIEIGKELSTGGYNDSFMQFAIQQTDKLVYMTNTINGMVGKFNKMCNKLDDTNTTDESYSIIKEHIATVEELLNMLIFAVHLRFCCIKSVLLTIEHHVK